MVPKQTMNSNLYQDLQTNDDLFLYAKNAISVAPAVVAAKLSSVKMKVVIDSKLTTYPKFTTPFGDIDRSVTTIARYLVNIHPLSDAVVCHSFNRLVYVLYFFLTLASI